MQPENRWAQSGAQRTETTYDAGLSSHFGRVYNIMTLGLVITGFFAYVVAHTPALMQLFYGTPLHWVVMFAPLVLVMFGFTPGRVQRSSFTTLTLMFAGFSAIFGISLAYIFAVYSGADITRVFFITSAMFAGTSIYGYTSKKDLSGMGGMMIMGVIGIVIASIVNLFMQSDTLMFVISIVGVIAFTGLTAWDTQRIKETYNAGYGAEANNKMAVMGALGLYINFINMFVLLLNLLGNRD
jgi:FtsH-binding integral membrane protein